jgi:predicted trehalose synthase
MQITVEIPDEIVAQAKASGQTPEVYVQSLLFRREPGPAPLLPFKFRRKKISIEEFFQGMAAHSEQIPPLPEEAYTRESFYQDHD